jgi:hypothetical protein
MKTRAPLHETGPFAPADRVAARVMLPGVNYDPAFTRSQLTWDRPKLKPHPYPGDDANNLTGRRFGRLVVLGYVDTDKRTGARWLVRCDCSMFTVRRSRALKGGQPDALRCNDCGYQLHLRRQAQYDKTGVWPPHGWEP